MATLSLPLVGYLWLRPPAGSASTEAASPTLQPPPAFAFDAVRMARGVYLLGRIVPGNAYVIETSAGLILIDTGIHPDAGHVLRQLDELKLSPDAVRMVLLTHVHADHVMGAQYFKRRTGAVIHAGAGDAPVLAAGQDKDAFFSQYTMSGVQLHPTEIDVELAGGETIRLGDTELTALATPGHTPGSICYLLERDGQRMLFTGDTISTLTAELGTYIARHPPRFRGDINTYAETFRQLLKLPAPDLVFPGHTEDDPPGQTPAMNARLWEELLQRGLRECQTISARFAEDGADFLAEEPLAILPGLLYLGPFRDWAIYAVLSGDALTLFDAPPGDDLPGFVEERMRRLQIQLPARRIVVLTSVDGRATANLGALVEQGGYEVVAPAAAVETLRGRLPAGAQIRSVDGWELPGGIPLSRHPIEGFGRWSGACEFHFAGKKVLVSGRVPVVPMERAITLIARELRNPGADPVALVKSLRQLRDLKPDVWLPATVVNDQNANLYDDDWVKTVDRNGELFEVLTQ